MTFPLPEYTNSAAPATHIVERPFEREHVHEGELLLAPLLGALVPAEGRLQPHLRDGRSRAARSFEGSRAAEQGNRAAGQQGSRTAGQRESEVAGSKWGPHRILLIGPRVRCLPALAQDVAVEQLEADVKLRDRSLGILDDVCKCR